MGDQGFIQFENNFALQHYGRVSEEAHFPLDHTLLSTSGSLFVYASEAIQHFRNRTYVILIDIPVSDAIKRIKKRSDGASRIIGMNG